MNRISKAVVCALGFIIPTALLPLQAQAQTTGRIEGSVFVDDNNNGVYDTGEDVASSATLLVLNAGKWTPVAGASFTVENGRFVFSNLPLGSYRVQLEFEGGVIRTTQNLEVTAENRVLQLDVPFARGADGSIEVPESYVHSDPASGGFSSGDDGRRSFVNITAIIGPELSPYKP